MDVLQEVGIGLLRLKDDVSSAAAGDLQVAALRSRDHSVCRPLVSSILLSYREVEELLVERGLEIDHTTVWRWVQRYAPELEERARPHLKATNKSWRVDETYVSIRAFGPRKFMKNSG